MVGVRPLATYSKIQEYVKSKYGNSIKTCWIAHTKELVGIKKRIASNRIDPTKRVYPCPEDKKEMIIDAFKYYGML